MKSCTALAATLWPTRALPRSCRHAPFNPSRAVSERTGYVAASDRAKAVGCVFFLSFESSELCDIPNSIDTNRAPANRSITTPDKQHLTCPLSCTEVHCARANLTLSA